MEAPIVVNTARRGRARGHVSRRVPERTGRSMELFGPRLRTYESIVRRRREARRGTAARGGRGGRGGATVHRRSRPGSKPSQLTGLTCSACSQGDTALSTKHLSHHSLQAILSSLSPNSERNSTLLFRALAGLSVQQRGDRRAPNHRRDCLGRIVRDDVPILCPNF